VRRSARDPVRGTTRVYGILGDPVAHSLSPVMQNAAFAAAGMDAIYVAFPVRPDDLGAALTGLRAAGIAGLNVTVPHKEAMVGLVDVLRPRARAARAVNTVIRTPAGLAGDNTDGDGFLAALAEARQRVRGVEVLLVGAGGSARGVAHALVRAGAARIVVANRTPARARALARALGARRASAAGLDLLADRRAVAGFDLIVNCTSGGLVAKAGGGARDALAALPVSATRPDVLCCDLLYGRTLSPFLRRARAAARRTLDGRGMLLHQGALAFELWTGRPAPLGVMRRALGPALTGGRAATRSGSR
jgi:shikimate dehydrogenase